MSTQKLTQLNILLSLINPTCSQLYNNGMRESATTLESELWPAELTYLKQALKKNPRAAKYLEIGTAAGGTLQEMMKCFDDDSRPQFVVIDPMTYFHNQLEIVKKNLRNNGFDPETVEFRVSKSKPAFFQAEAVGEKYDFILIDGAHKIHYVIQDLRWTRLLNVGGLLCMHDYNQKHKGVMWSAERLLRKFSNYRKETLVDSLIMIRKIAPSSKPEINMLDILWANLWSQVLQWERNVKKHLPFLFKKK